jgi:hypothetical protein
MSDNRRLSAEAIARFQAEQAEWLKRGGFERDAIERAERLRAKEEAEWRERDLEVRLAVEAILERPSLRSKPTGRPRKLPLSVWSPISNRRAFLPVVASYRSPISALTTFGLSSRRKSKARLSR